MSACNIFFQTHESIAADQYWWPDYNLAGINASYQYRYKRWNFGMTLGLNWDFNTKTDWKWPDNRKGISFLVVMPSFKYSWVYHRLLRLYSGLGARATFLLANKKMSHSHVAFAGHVTLVGVSAGRRVFGFFELGVGNLGVVNLGVGYRFDSKNLPRGKNNL